MILLLTHRGDAHLAPVLAGLRRRRARFGLLDTSRLPLRADLAFALGGAAPPALRLDGGPARFAAAEVRAVWYRRPRPFAPDRRIALGAHRAFAWKETAGAVAGLFHCLAARWVNDLVRDREAQHKVRQLALAQECGLAVPRTCVTNVPDLARRFLREVAPAQVVFKALDARPETWRETRLVGRAERRLLPLVRQAPVIFQEYVPGVDVRVTCVGPRLFAAGIDARATAYPEDFRLAYDQARVRPVRLPREVARALRALLARLGLLYAAVDLRRSPGGEYLFLEANPSGQFLFVEERTGQPIAEALCDLLVGG